MFSVNFINLKGRQKWRKEKQKKQSNCYQMPFQFIFLCFSTSLFCLYRHPLQYSLSLSFNGLLLVVIAIVRNTAATAAAAAASDADTVNVDDICTPAKCM